MAIGLVIALVLSCVAITITSIDNPYGKNDEQIKRLERLYNHSFKKLDETIDRVQLIENKLATPELKEIKPLEAFQISDLSSSGQKAALAIDEDLETATHTKSHLNPWLTVDMGKKYHITRVVVTNWKIKNRPDVVNRATNLRVGVTNTRPVVGGNLPLNAYALCGEKPGLMGEVGDFTCQNNVSGRYLVVQFQITSWMNIAEVQIYGF